MADRRLTPSSTAQNVVPTHAARKKQIEIFHNEVEECTRIAHSFVCVTSSLRGQFRIGTHTLIQAQELRRRHSCVCVRCAELEQ